MSPPEMGQVIPFIARVRESGDWSAAERARLEELADRLAAEGLDVEVIFGATDEGDPWCVVTDAGGDVLIHVARIGGKFVVHSAMDDVLAEGADLHAVLRERLDAAEEAAPQTAEVLPFAARQGQTFVALLIAAAFFYETAGVSEPAQAAELPKLGAEPEPPPAAPDAETPAQERELAVQGAALRDPAERQAQAAALAIASPTGAASVQSAPSELQPPPAPAPAPPPAVEARAEILPALAPQAQAVLAGSDGDDVLQGTAADERIEGGAGADTLRGGGGHDSLLGGAGDDRIELAAEAVAVGGEGADTFVLVTPAAAQGPDRLLGVIFDFDAVAGDRLVTAQGREIQVPPATPQPGTQPRPDEFNLTQTPPPLQDPTPPDVGSFGPATLRPPVTRVEVDLDGDGQMDGYVLLSYGRQLPLQDPAIGVTGQSLSAADPFA